MQVAGQGSLTISLDRNFGTGLGSLIQGTFTLRGSGPEAVQNLTVYFNGEQVHFVTGNTIAWQFNTGDYPSGSTNITLFGVDDVGAIYIASRQVTFLGGAASNIFTFGILALVVIVILARYGPRLMGLRKSEPRTNSNVNIRFRGVTSRTCRRGSVGVNEDSSLKVRFRTLQELDDYLTSRLSLFQNHCYHHNSCEQESNY
jgi:hypothetical protein